MISKLLLEISTFDMVQTESLEKLKSCMDYMFEMFNELCEHNIENLEERLTTVLSGGDLDD